MQVYLNIIYLSPPRITAALKLVYLANLKVNILKILFCCLSQIFEFSTSFVNLNVWIANSLVGDMIKARGPLFGLLVFRFSFSCNLWSIGNRNAAVLPLPVRAIATTSLPNRISGMDLIIEENNFYCNSFFSLRRYFENRNLNHFSLDWSWLFISAVQYGLQYLPSKTWFRFEHIRFWNGLKNFHIFITHWLETARFFLAIKVGPFRSSKFFIVVHFIQIFESWNKFKSKNRKTVKSF